MLDPDEIPADIRWRYVFWHSETVYGPDNETKDWQCPSCERVWPKDTSIAVIRVHDCDNLWRDSTLWWEECMYEEKMTKGADI